MNWKIVVVGLSVGVVTLLISMVLGIREFLAEPEFGIFAAMVYPIGGLLLSLVISGFAFLIGALVKPKEK